MLELVQPPHLPISACNTTKKVPVHQKLRLTSRNYKIAPRNQSKIYTEILEPTDMSNKPEPLDARTPSYKLLFIIRNGNIF